jgi:hypothetical protein
MAPYMVLVDPSESGLSVDCVEQSLPLSAFRANSPKFEPRHRWAAQSKPEPHASSLATTLGGG